MPDGGAAGASEDIDVISATAELAGVAIRTPMRRLHWLERIVGVPVWAKLECQQRTGSFKFRGAYTAIRRSAETGSVVAASAGNHGYAVAEVARELGVEATICIPATASRLKREHIIAAGAGLLEYGSSLDEATEHARRLAADDDRVFISPYNDPAVIAGNASIAIEMLDQVDELRTLVVPAGGGGLISGMALGARALGVAVSMVACQPARYPSLARSVEAGEARAVLNQPTLADGLAVNLEPGSITIDLVREHVERIVTLDEEELAAGTLAALIHESVLVEPAGAAAIVACIRLARAGQLDGPVGIPLCGGNLSHAALVRAHRFPYADEDLVSLLDLRGRTTAATPVVKRPKRLAAAESSSAAADELQQQLRATTEGLRSVIEEIEALREYCDLYGVLLDEVSAASLAGSATRAAERLEGIVSELPTADADSDKLAVAESALRWALSTLAHVREALDWCSPSYDQSRVRQFAELGSQDSPRVNYERYEHAPVRRVEAQLVEALGFDTDRVAVTATSSGMAAYALVEAFLLRHRLEPNDSVLLAPYIYFEATEQLLSLPGIRPQLAESYDAAEIAEQARRTGARVVFADPIANDAEQRLIALEQLATELRRRSERRLTLVIDGTMVSAGLAPELLDGDDKLEVIYYESCSKYLQLGLDLSMAGFVAHPVELAPTFDRLRRNTGAILGRHGAHLFPTYDRPGVQRRMQRICANAAWVAARIAADPAVTDACAVVHPSLPSHPDHALASDLPYAGGCVTFRFYDPGRNHREELEAVILASLQNARRRGIHLTKGVSFGFSAPRISAASAMAESAAPFLRLYAGDRAEDRGDLADAVRDALVEAAAR